MARGGRQKRPLADILGAARTVGRALLDRIALRRRSWVGPSDPKDRIRVRRYCGRKEEGIATKNGRAALYVCGANSTLAESRYEAG